MIKKNFFRMFVSILSLGCMVFSLASCSDDSNPEQPKTEEQAKKELVDAFTNSIGFDVSDLVLGKDRVSLWELKEDSTFTCYRVSGVNSPSEDDWEVDSLKGEWHAFVNEENQWNEDVENLSGFHAVFDVKDTTGIGLINNEQTYYVASVEDSVAVIMSEGFVDYAITTGYEADEKLSTRIIFPFFSTILLKVIDESETVRNWFINTFGVDKSSYNLNEAQSKEFWTKAEQTVKEMQNGNNTDYSNWMGQIYKGKEKTTRICDMNIPGTHDTFTHYMEYIIGTSGVIADYARTQLKNISKQWDAGIRAFDVRFRTTKGNFTTTIDEFTEDGMLGMFHGTIYCGVTAEYGIRTIYSQLAAHPTETAIVFCAFEGDAGAEEYKLAREVMEKFKDRIVWDPTPDMTLKDCAGKMIVMQSWDRHNRYDDYRIGPFFGTGDDTYVNEGYIQFYNLGKDVFTPLYYQNRYQSSTTKRCTDFWNEKRALMQKCFLETAKTKNTGKNVWAVNQASAYVGGIWIHMSYAKSANTMNPWTLNFVSEHRKEKLGIIEMDYAGTNDEFDGFYTNGADLPKVIVETNRYQ